MYYNYLSKPNISRSMQSSFAGLNKNARIGDGEFADMTNMSSDYAPLLSPRKKRSVVQKQISETVTETVTDEEGNESKVEITEYKKLNGILGDVGFCAVWGGDFYYMGNKVEDITLDDGEKKLVAMGANILIFPDGVYYNTATGESGSMETGETHEGTGVFYGNAGIVLEDGRVCGDEIEVNYTYTNVTPSGKDSLPLYLYFGELTSGKRIYDQKVGGNYFERIPARVKDGYIEYVYTGSFRSTSSGSYAHSCVFYSATEWRRLPVKSISLAEAPSVTSNNLWANGERIHISGNLLTLEPAGYIGSALTNIASAGTNSATINANYRWTGRNFPVFDYVCVHNNRLWGCRNGIQVSGTEAVNEIYCSKLNDFKVWTTSSETTTLAGDPYTMSVGEYGAFTGCISHRGQLLFFKDNIVYRVSGNKPANFQIDKISESGLQSGCEKSLEIIDEVLYYKSRNGVFAYDGSIPQKISGALGDFYYTDAVAGKHFSKYYITMIHDGVRKLYVYDTRYRLWHAEDDIDVRFFTEYNGALYGGVDNNIVCLAGESAEIFTEAEIESDFDWSAESGDIGLSSPYQKYYHRLLIRMDMEIGARVKVELACDGGDWLIVSDFTAPYKRSFLMPIVTPRCDHMRYRISGKGNSKIYSISYETETVGDRQM